MNSWLMLVTSLPTENATVRQRAWRALKASGAAVLRDGVYLMPQRADCRLTLERLAADVRAGGGAAQVLGVTEPDGGGFIERFDRGGDYAALLAEVAQARGRLDAETAPDAIKQARKLRKTLSGLIEIDFFPGEARRQTDSALSELEQACAQFLSPGEPSAQSGVIERLAIADFQGRTWATRKRPWVDRLASAWLIRRFIDPHAAILWLASPQDCPADALGFDFDGARFSHVGSRVSFEVLVASFGLDQAALLPLGQLVHFLDVGGVQPAQAAGVEGVLAGLREAVEDDDQLLACACPVFDGLLATFAKQTVRE